MGFFAWLARSALNHAIDRIRRSRQIQLENTDDAPTIEPDAERRLLDREIGRRISAALAVLPEP
jgi:DNA-directed RNA polymerase specialized sigma24 family protein